MQFAQRQPSATSWMRYWQRKASARLRLFCFPYAGGNAAVFRSLSEQAPAAIEVCPIQLPGRDDRFNEPPFSSLHVLLEALQKALLPYLDLPYAFFGHSMGALISFELARALRRQGQVPAPIHLFVAGHRAPHLPDPQAPVHALPTPQFIEALRHYQGTPEVILNHAELLQILLPLLRADFAVCETYCYSEEAPLTCPIFALGGQQDRDTPHDALQAWREHTSSSFQMRIFAGNHFFLNQQQTELSSLLYQELLRTI